MITCFVASMVGVLSEIVGAVCGISLQACSGIIHGLCAGSLFGLL